MLLPKKVRLLVVGAPGSGKSQGIVDLALALPQATVYCLDPLDSVGPLVVKHGEEIPNLKLYGVVGETALERWQAYRDICISVRASGVPGDWLAFDGAAVPWNLAKDAHIWRAYGEDPAEFLGAILKDAQETSMERRGRRSNKPLGVGGLTPDDWEIIRGNYYRTIPQSMASGCPLNVWVTAEETTPMAEKKGESYVFKEANLPHQFKADMAKPQGEKGLTGSVDGVVRLRHPSRTTWEAQIWGKSRLWEETTWKNVTYTYLWRALCEMNGWEPTWTPR